MRRKKIVWNQNDVFGIPLMNGNYAIGHILDQRMKNTVRIAIYGETVADYTKADLSSLINKQNLISLTEVTREQLDYGVWKIIGSKATTIPSDKYPNEEFRHNKWINAIVRDAAIAEDFVNSFYGFLPWDDWFDPHYLDKWLIDISKKPVKLLYKN